MTQFTYRCTRNRTGYNAPFTDRKALPTVGAIDRTETEVNQAMLQYSYLQVLDLLTTIAFLAHGVREGNPLVRLALEYAPNPLGGLLAVKIAGICLGLYCWQRGKERLLNRMSALFAVVVAWNLAALIASSVV